jgi:hypothetical protein
MQESDSACPSRIQLPFRLLTDTQLTHLCTQSDKQDNDAAGVQAGMHLNQYRPARQQPARAPQVARSWQALARW